MVDRFARGRIARLVDKGRVMCPVQLCEVEVAGCVECPFLDEAVSNEAAPVKQIYCRPDLWTLARAASSPPRTT